MIKIAILGYGTIGSGVVEVLRTNRESIAKRAGSEIGVKYILDLRDFPGDPMQEKVVHDYEVIANDPEVQVVVEAMGGVEPAYTFVKRALLAGKNFTTSNKALVAKHGAELIAIAKEQGRYTGRKAKQSPDFDRVVAQWRRGEITATEAMRTLKMSKSSFYRRVKQTTDSSTL